MKASFLEITAFRRFYLVEYINKGCQGPVPKSFPNRSFSKIPLVNSCVWSNIAMFSVTATRQLTRVAAASAAGVAAVNLIFALFAQISCCTCLSIYLCFFLF